MDRYKISAICKPIAVPLVMLLTVNCLHAQTDKRATRISVEERYNCGILISKNDYVILLDSFIKKMAAKEKLSRRACTELVKLYNGIPDLDNEAEYRTFLGLFGSYLHYIATKLKMNDCLNYYYSKKYHLCIGRSDHDYCRSRYHVVDSLPR